MRITSQQRISTSTGIFVAIDPFNVLERSEQSPYFVVPNGVAFFDTIGMDGSFKVYESPECTIVDTAPRLFKASSRSQFKILNGAVTVDSACIVIMEAPNEEFVRRHEESSVAIRVEAGDYVTWCEEHETSIGSQRVIIGIGKKPHLFLAGGDAGLVAELEKDAAAALRMKGREKQHLMIQIKRRVLDLYFSGSKDGRLAMLAASLKLDLPARRGNVAALREAANKTLDTDA